MERAISYVCQNWQFSLIDIKISNKSKTDQRRYDSTCTDNKDIY